MRTTDLALIALLCLIVSGLNDQPAAAHLLDHIGGQLHALLYAWL